MNYLIPKIPFVPRLIIFAGLVALGIFIQYAPGLEARFDNGIYFWLGFLCMLLGSIFVISRSYNNKPLDLGFEDWKPVTRLEFNKIKDNLTNTKRAKIPFYFKPTFGGLVLTGLGGFLFFLFIIDVPSAGFFALFLNAAIILYAPSFTGAIKLWTPWELSIKMDRFNGVIQAAETSGKNLTMTPYLRFDKDKENRQIPEDIRIMIEPKRKPADFVGVQFQVAINNGPNGAVPYMYAVFLCKGKGETYQKLSQASYKNMVREPGGDKEYGYVVVRQQTSGGGYHTSNKDCLNLYEIVESQLIRLG
jgi:hypothetical protein